MNCSVISVNILAPLESRIFSISLTYRRRRRRGGDRGDGYAHACTRVEFIQTDFAEDEHTTTQQTVLRLT